MSDHDSIPALLLLVWLSIGVLVYLLPTTIALLRNHHRKITVFVVNLLLGWTAIIWLVLLFWTIFSDRRPPMEVHLAAARQANREDRK